MAERIPATLARQIRLVGLDVDGVLTDGGLYMGKTAQGEAVELKRFEITDGLGIKLLERAGIAVALVSGRESDATSLRAEELGLEVFQDSRALKLPAMGRLLERHGAGWHEVAFMSDDLADLPVLRRAALPVAVANAVPEVKAEARWRTQRGGGRGAVREFAEALLRARGEWDGLVRDYCEALEVEEGG